MLVYIDRVADRFNRYKSLLSVVGFVVALYLTITHYTASIPLACPSIGIIDCGTVLSSKYAVLFGIPLAVMALAFFIGEIVLIVKNMKEYQLYLNTVGFFSLFYTWYAEYLLQRICIYCTALHIIIIVLFAISLYEAFGKKQAS